MAERQRFLEPADDRAAWSWSRDRDEPRRRATLPPKDAGGERVAQGGHDDELLDDELAGVRGGPDAPGGADPDLPVFVISVAAEMSELHPQTLRAYERDGLLSPFRTPGGTRRYSLRDVERLRLIRRLTQEEGLNLAGVRLVLDLGEKLERARRRTGELEEMVRVLAARLEQRPASSRFEIVKAPAAGMELHRSSRRTGSRGTGSVQRARPLPPPDQRGTDQRGTDPRAADPRDPALHRTAG
jgi:MerR family transcriptional regulator, heat shock protein HspR